MFDALVIGTGPAGLAIAAALCQRGVAVGGLAPTAPDAEWVNTYGIWEDELDTLGLRHLLAHQWDDCVSYFSANEKVLNRVYGLFDKHKFQAHLLDQCGYGSDSGIPNPVQWHHGKAAQIAHSVSHSTITTQDGICLEARIVIDASGHKPALVKRSSMPSTGSTVTGSTVTGSTLAVTLIQEEAKKEIKDEAKDKENDGLAYQAAYGIVGKFSAPPINAGRFVLMDYRADHLTEEEQQDSPTFLYAMDWGNDVFFLEETSLAECPAVSFETLKHRLHKRLAYQGVKLEEILDEEYCLFPMNSPMPAFDQAVVGFGGAASMGHPATGYMVGALLRRAPALADGIVAALKEPHVSPNGIAKAAWQSLWPSDRLRKYYIYLFGLETLMRFDRTRLCCFFNTFFNLPQSQWSGFLADTLSSPELVLAMLNLFSKAPNSVRGGLIRSVGSDGPLLVRSLFS